MASRRISKGFRISSAYLLAGSLALLFLGVLLFYLGTRHDEANTLVTGLASAFVSVGAVTLVTEGLLRNAYTYDLLELVGLEQDVYDTGLQELSDEPRFAWAWLFDGGAGKVRVALLDPRAWMLRDWPNLVDQAQQRGIDIEVYFPKSGSPAATTASAILGLDEPVYAGHIDAAVSDMIGGWKLQDLHARSFFTITPIGSPLSHGLFQCDDRLVFVFPGMHGPRGGSVPLVVAFDNKRGKSIWHKQAERTWKHLEQEGAPPEWTNRRPVDDPNRSSLDVELGAGEQLPTGEVADGH